jgi:YD repeat-containing protein
MIKKHNGHAVRERVGRSIWLGTLVIVLLGLNPTLSIRSGGIWLGYQSAFADNFQYQYDPTTGRITTATDTTTGQVAQYSYDAVGNITGVQVSNPSSANLGVTNTGNTATTTYTGQGELLTFSGTDGQSLSLTINYNSANIPGITIDILNPDGTLTPAQSITCPSGGTPPSCNGTEVISLAALPENGTYQIVVQPQPAYSGSGTLSFTLTNRGLNALPAILNLILK